jgi:hypothetical protein
MNAYKQIWIISIAISKSQTVRIKYLSYIYIYFFLETYFDIKNDTIPKKIKTEKAAIKFIQRKPILILYL